MQSTPKKTLFSFSHFFRISWTIQLLVGISLFIVSFMIEKQVLEAFILTPMLAVMLAASLELGKAVAIIWHRYMKYRESLGYPSSIKWASSIFRIGLVLLSMLCSLLFLAHNLDRPKLEQVRGQEIERGETRLSETLKRLDKAKEERLNLLEQSQEVEYSKVRDSFEKRIKTLENNLRKEMNNVVNGTFKGPRYKAIKTDLEQEKAKQVATLAQLAKQNKQAYSAESERLQNILEQKRQKAYEQSDSKRSELIKNDFADDDRVNNGHVVAFLKLYESMFSTEILPLQFVFVFSLLLSLLVEVGILLAFDTITLAILPSLHASHEAELSNDVLKTKIDNDSLKEQMQHEEALNRIRNTANNVMNKANEYMRAST